MNDHSAAPVTFALFVLRHSIAAGLMIASVAVLWTATYAALLLWAMFFGGGVGSPVAYPLTLLLLVGVSIAAICLLFSPATAVAEFVCRRLRWAVLAQIPVSTVILAGLCAPVAFVVAHVLGMPEHRPSFGVTYAWLLLLALLPQGIFWWLAQGTLVAAAAFRSISRLIRVRSTHAFEPPPN